MRNLIVLCSGIALALCACGASQETVTQTTSTAPAAEPAATPVVIEGEAAPPTAAAPAPPAGIAPQPPLDTSGRAPEVSPRPRLDDGEIGEVVDTIDDAEIAAGELVMDKSHDPAVKELAAGVVKEHKRINQDLGALMLRLVIPPRDSDLSRSLSEQAEANLARLEGLEGTALDQAFLEGRVAMNRDLLVALDQSLVPSATNQDLEEFVAALRPMLATHLQHAKVLQYRMARR